MMGKSFVFRKGLVPLLIAFFSGFPLIGKAMVVPFTQNRQEQKKKQDEKGTEAKKPTIKEVPKARKQGRPTVVVKPKVNVKPIKIIRPKIRKP